MDSQLDGALISSLNADRRETERLTTALPVLEIDGERRLMLDFSTDGFRANLPEKFRTVGKSGLATLHISAAGYAIRKHVRFNVRHVSEGSVGASFETIETISDSSGLLF